MNCELRTIQELQSVDYAANGTIKRQLSEPQPIVHPTPETIGEAVYEMACVPGGPAPK